MPDRYTWIKLYTEILSDPKMGRLNNFLWRRAVELFLLAGINGKGGELQPVEEMAWLLHADDESELVRSLMSLAEIGVVRQMPEGNWMVVNFAKRQAAMSDAERQRKHRAGDNSSNPGKASQGCHATVTEEEVEEETESSSTSGGAPPNVFALYEKNFGSLTSMISDDLKDLEATYTAAWVAAAMTEAVHNEARNLKYVAAILKRWKTEGFRSKYSKTAPKGRKQTQADVENDLSAWVSGG